MAKKMAYSKKLMDFQEVFINAKTLKIKLEK